MSDIYCNQVQQGDGTFVCSLCGWTHDKIAYNLCQKKDTRIPLSYPRPEPNLEKVGTELSELLAKFGIKANEGCKCKARALEMDHRGVAWCEKNIELIVDWLEEESTKRHLPFVRAAGKILVRRAIRNAKRQSKESLKHQDDPIHQLKDKFEMRPTDEAFTN
jgi:hypothetical protein